MGLRVCLADRLRTHARFIVLLKGEIELGDDVLLKRLRKTRLTVVDHSSLPWYPSGKYQHRGKDVLKIGMTALVEADWTSSQEWSYVILYADGSKRMRREPRHLRYVERLIRRLGFETHVVYESSVYDDECVSQVVAVPREAPAMWAKDSSDIWSTEHLFEIDYVGMPKVVSLSPGQLHET